MAINQPHQAYKQNAINTSSPGDLTLMLYNGCLKFIKLAKIAMEKNDVKQRNINLMKAQNIINELMITLDMNIEISKEMLPLYDYMHRRLVDANIQNSVEIVEEVETFVLDFRNTWKEAMLIVKKQNPSPIGKA
jgi:flagellar protein FliS